MLHNPWMLTAGILEFGGGILIGLGLFTRPVAFLLCGEMAVAYFKQHFPAGFWPIMNHGEPGGALLLFLSLPGGARRRHAEHRRSAGKSVMFETRKSKLENRSRTGLGEFRISSFQFRFSTTEQ